MRITEEQNKANIALKNELRERGFYVRVIGSQKEEIEYLVVSAQKDMPKWSNYDIIPHEENIDWSRRRGGSTC